MKKKAKSHGLSSHRTKAAVRRCEGLSVFCESHARLSRHNLRLFQGLKFRWQAKRWTHWTKKTVASNHLHNYETKKAAIFRRRDARIPGKGNSLPFLINRRHLGSGLRFSWSTQHHVLQFLAFTKPSSQNLRRREATFDTRTKNSPCFVDKMRWSGDCQSTVAVRKSLKIVRKMYWTWTY